MIELNGKYNTAKVFTDNIEQSTISQIIALCNHPILENSKIRIMPDVHTGAGVTIGTTISITDKVVPNWVGVDIGCGMEVVKLKEKHIEPQQLDKLIYSKIPCGMSIRNTVHRYVGKIDLTKLYCYNKFDFSRIERSLGTLGGGNHFIEVDKADDKSLYIIIHSGSRHLGVEVATYYQNEAHKQHNDIQHHLAYCSGELFEQYIHDMKIVQEFATINRQAIMDEIIKGLHLHVKEQFTTIHNYIDTENMVVRKGAISAQKDEKVVIPINMRDGSLICIGKGNEDWNYSAPHGAGRLMSRSDAKQSFTVSEFKKQMKGIYSTSITQESLDESPMAYKSINDIINNIEPTVDVQGVIKPIYNFKAH